MTVLSDQSIVKLIANKEIIIEPFKEANLTPNGYDLTVSEIEIPNKENISKGKLRIPPNHRFAISTKEVISCGQNHCAQLWLRTSWARKGIICSFGKIDSGFKGNLTLLGLNSSEDDVNIEVGNTFAQIVFEKLSTPADELYSDRSGNYQNQKGITWSKE
ncbi:MAG: dCTP deaminase [Rhodobiaceae bacterium]|nr:dCTP deaminase [Rhodobiaceae bacterium]